MARTPKAPITPAVARWAREIAGYTVEEAAKRVGTKPERLEAWEAGDGTPTIAQVRKLALAYRRTPAFFFLPAPPESDLPSPPDFRGGTGSLSPSLRRELRRAVERRAAFLQLEGPPDRSLTGFGLSADDPSTPDAIREWLGMPLSLQTSVGDASAALSKWIGSVENAGVLVFQMSRISQSEARGFSVFDAVAPVIVLNGADPPEARSFTLLHELCHLLHSSGGLCTMWVNVAVEQRCNSFAAETLMPTAAFIAALGNEDDPIGAVQRLASQFRVSRHAAAIRLRRLGRLTDDQVEQIAAETQRRIEETRERQREREGGPAHYRTQLRNLGPRYVSAVLDAVQARSITMADAAHYLESKVETIDRMEAELAARSNR